MTNLINQYHEAKLARYNQTLGDARQAQIAAKFAVDDLAMTIKRQKEIGYSMNDIEILLMQEIEDTWKMVGA